MSRNVLNNIRVSSIPYLKHSKHYYVLKLSRKLLLDFGNFRYRSLYRYLLFLLCKNEKMKLERFSHPYCPYLCAFVLAVAIFFWWFDLDIKLKSGEKILGIMKSFLHVSSRYCVYYIFSISYLPLHEQLNIFQSFMNSLLSYSLACCLCLPVSIMYELRWEDQ